MLYSYIVNKSQSIAAFVTVALLATSTVAFPKESLTDFLTDGAEAAAEEAGKKAKKDKKPKKKKTKGKSYKKSKEDVEELNDFVEQSAADVGLEGDYMLYAERLAKTLAMLSPEQQARIFD